ncbi:MAG: Na+-transporting NADH:ubiquinone oxidoreductase subunit B [Candidatus Marinamargulisbacteria bacterium]|jgi:Na+-transporting NADH:ubiquinone oxidoreductase subunit B
MKFLRELVDAQEKHFESGGKLETFYPAFEAFQTLLFTPKSVTKAGAHVRDSLDTKRYMSIVILSLVPCLLFGIYNTGYQTRIAAGLSTALLDVVLAGLIAILPLLAVSYGVGLGWEFLFSIVRGHEINEGFLVTGLLYALILPPTMPLWQVGLGITFAVIIGKEVFGGTGRNFLNPALTARAFLFFTFPAFISGDKVWTRISVAKDAVVDTFSGATPLAVAAAANTDVLVETQLADAGFTLSNLFFGWVPGSIGETSVFCVLIGAGILLITGIGSWRTMLGCLIGAVCTVQLFNFFAGPESLPFLTLPTMWQLCMGGFAFGAVFMATDPVSSPALDESKWVYGILIGVFAIIIRVINPAYPEGMMLAILLMNVFAPLIDHVMVSRRTKKRIPNVI